MEQPSLQIQTESHWANPDELISIQHRNSDRIWFRLYSGSFPQKTFNKETLPNFLKDRAPVLSWDQELPNKGEYRHYTTLCTPPNDKPLPMGYHFLVASSSENLVWKDEAVAYTPVHITKIALSCRRSPKGGIEGFVVDALTGAPLPDIKITATEYKTTQRRTKEQTSDSKGFFHFPSFT